MFVVLLYQIQKYGAKVSGLAREKGLTTLATSNFLKFFSPYLIGEFFTIDKDVENLLYY